MRNHIIKITATIACSLLLASCSQELIEPSSEGEILSRATTPGEISETNPTLLTDWENCRSIVLSEVAANGENLTIEAPWISGSNSSLDEKFRTDIKKQDGWIMLFHTFCKTNHDINLGYMFFYNRFSGYVKVFSYNPNVVPSTKSVWRLQTNLNRTPSAIFNENEYFSHPLDDTNEPTIWAQDYDNVVNGSNSVLENGWNGFQFRVGEYNPDNIKKTLVVGAYNTIYTDFKFEGEENSTITGKITTVHTKDKSIYDNAVAEAILNKGGEKVKPIVDSIAKKFLDKKILGLNLKDMLAKVEDKDYAGLLKSGLSLFFKGSSRDKTNYSVSEVNLQSHGTLTLSGSGVTVITSGVSPLNFNLNEILSANYGGDYASLSEYYGDKIELGVWTLKNKPTVYYNRYTKFTNMVNTDYESSILEFHGVTPYPETHVGDVEVVFNPAIKNLVKSYDITIKMVDVEGGNRIIDNKGKNLLNINYVNLLKEDKSIVNATVSPNIYKLFRVYGVSPSNSGFERDVYGMLEGLNPGITLNENTNYYIDWGENLGGNRVAVITLTITVMCGEKEAKFTDSRLYDVNYAPDPYQGDIGMVNTPPYSFLLNHKNNIYYGFDLK